MMQEIDSLVKSMSSFMDDLHAGISKMEKYLQEMETNTMVQKIKITDEVRNLGDGIRALSENGHTIVKQANSMLELQSKIMEKYKSCMDAEIEAMQKPISTKIGSWVDEKVSWKEVVTRKQSDSTEKPQEPRPAFSCSSKTTADGTWYNINIQATDVPISEGGLITKLLTVENETQLSALPSGMLVYHRGLEVPKVIMTTGKAGGGPSVPLGCRIWDYNDDSTTIKYSRFNPNIQTSANCDESMFYIDDIVAKKCKLHEDQFRNFRHASKNNSWHGYYVYKCPTFGDSRYLHEQFMNVTTTDTFDIYQYSLWLSLVSVYHYNSLTPYFAK